MEGPIVIAITYMIPSTADCPREILSAKVMLRNSVRPISIRRIVAAYRYMMHMRGIRSGIDNQGCLNLVSLHTHIDPLFAWFIDYD